MPLVTLNYPKFFPTFQRKPWVYFLIFAMTNALLSYASLNLQSKLWIGLLGWGLPFLLVWLTTPVLKDGMIAHSQEFLKPIPGWSYLVLFLAAFLIRSITLFHPNWDHPDDGLNAYLPLQFSKEWKRLFFFTQNDIPAFFYWVLTLYFKVVTPSLFSARILLWILSLVSVFLFGFACRSLFTKSFSFLAGALFSMSFWPIYCFKFISCISFSLIWEIMTFWILGLFFWSKSSEKIKFHAFALGLALGTGFWVAIQWVLMILMVIPVFISKWKNQNLKSRWSSGLCFVTLVLLFLGPFLYLYLSHGNGGHIRWLLTQEFKFEVYKRLDDLFSNWTCLFWFGGTQITNGYHSEWGGMFNPIEGALCFIGFLRMWAYRNSPFVRWFLAALVVLMIPGLLTEAYVIFHNLLVLPFLILLCAFGAQFLLENLPEKNRFLALGAVFLCSVPLSVTQLNQTYRSDPTPFSRALGFLNGLQAKEGPGMILLDLETNTEDQNLTLATYPFNAAENPKLDASGVKWAAVIVNVHYKPFLSSRFPDSQWVELGPDGFWNQGGLVLAVFPITDDRRAVFQNWLVANQKFHSISIQTYMKPSEVISEGVFRQLLDLQDVGRGDPFLESVYCEKMIFEQKNRLPAAQLLPWMERGVEKGYPVAHLLVTEGILLQASGHPREARLALERAVHAPLDLTSASQILRSSKP